MLVVAVPIELGDVERPGNVKPSFVIFFVASVKLIVNNKY